MSLWFKIVAATIVVILPYTIAIHAEIYFLPVWLCLTLFTVAIFKLLLTDSNDYLYATFLCFYYIFIILAPLLQISRETYPWIDSYLNEQISMAWWISCLSLFAFEIGYNSYRPARKSPDNSIKLLALHAQHHPISIMGGRILFISALLCTAVGLSIVGVETLFLPRNEASLLLKSKLGDNSPVQSIINAVMRVPPALIMLIFLADFFKSFQFHRKVNPFSQNSIFLIILFLLVLIINNPISTARFWVGAIAFSIILIYLLLKTNKSAFFWFIINFSCIVLIFPLTDLYRKSLEFNIFEDKIDIDPAEELVTSPDFDAFQQLLNTITVVNEHGHTFGNQFLSSMLFYIPRSIWPDKAEATGRYIAVNLGYQFENLSAPIMAEFYIDGGIFLVIFGMLLLGILYKKLFYHSKRKSLLIVTFYCFFTAYQFYLLRGSLMTVSNYLLIAAITLFLIYQYRYLLMDLHFDRHFSPYTKTPIQ